MTIQIVRNEDGNCIEFRGSSNPVYYNACLSAEVDATFTDTVNVINDVATAATSDTVYEFYNIPYTEFRDSDNNPFADATTAADYITAQGHVLVGDNTAYRGVWDADTNTPDISATSPSAGDFYFISVAGTTTLGDSSSWSVHDRAIYNGTSWQRVRARQLIDGTNRSVLLNTNTAVFADGEGATGDPLNRTPGWYYTNTENNKINWYIFGDNQNIDYELGDFGGFYAVIDFRNTTSQPYFTLYTRMELDGSDGGVWYRSRQNYSDPTTMGAALTTGAGQTPAETRFLVHSAGLDVSAIEPSLTRISLGKDTTTTVGPEGAAEEIYLMALSTSSGRAAGSEEFVVEKVGYKTGDLVQEFQLSSPPTTGASIDDEQPASLDFRVDATNTTILVDDGTQYGVNSIHAIDNGDGTIDIAALPSNQVIYDNLAFGNITINGGPALNSSAAKANALNALFQVSPLGAGGDYAPTYPTIDAADVTGTTAEGTTPTTTKSDGSTLHYLTTGADLNGHGSRFWSTETIDTAGEYYLVKVTGNGRFIIGFADGTSDDLTELANNSGTAHSGLIWSQAFYDYGSYTAPWTWYGSSSAGVAQQGWSGSTTEQMRYNTTVQTAIDSTNNSDGALFKAGIDSQGYLAVWYYDDGRSNDWIMCSRRSVTTDGSKDYHLVVKLWNGSATLVEIPQRVATDPAAPVLNYRYIESPDGTFYYPLFATAEEANYVDTENGGAGESHTHIFVDEPTMSTWYMPSTGGTHTGTSAPANTAEITYTEIPTNADDLYAPSDLTLSDQTFAENASVNIPIQPVDQVPVATVSGLPGDLVFQGGSIVGVTRYVTGDQTTPITVQRTNVYGTNTQTFNITITDNVSLNTITGFTSLKADQISHQPDNIPEYSPEAAFDFDLTLDEDTEFTWTQSNGASPNAGPGEFLQIGIVSSGVDKATTTLGDTSGGWELKAAMWTDRLNRSENGPTGWDSNGTVNTGSNDGVTWKLSHEEDPVHGSNHHIVLYRNGVEVARSADHYNGPQTITIVYPEDYDVNIRLPGISKTNIGAGSTTPPSGFVDPLLAGEMDSLTVLGSDAEPDSAVQLTETLDPGKRYVFPRAWVEANILPYVQDDGNDVYVGVPQPGASFSDVGTGDFDAMFNIEGTASTSHVSKIKVDPQSGDNFEINSLTNAFYDYALEWDGEDLHVIACNIGDINTQAGISNGGSFARVMSYTGYGTASGLSGQALDMVIGVDNGGQINLVTSGLQEIDIPYGANDIRVSEVSETEARFDVGNGPVTTDSITLNAGYTYRFYLNNASIESGDTLTFETADGTAYTTGVTTVGSHGDYNYYVQFVVPTDVPPIHPVWNGTDQPAVQISGSTYVTPVTGITLEGPAANFTGNVINSGAGNHGWVSVNETLGAGQRLVMDTAFLTDLVSAMPNGSYVYVGVKGPSWDNDIALDTYSPIFIVGKLTESDVRLNFTGSTQAYTSLATLTSSGQQAFLEITNSGDNVRGGYGPQDASAVAYADWTSGAKNQTGDQGYGLTTAEVAIQWQGLAGNTTGFDVTDVDWTGLTEVSIPTPAVSLTTPWTKALDFSGSSERAQMVSSSTSHNPLMMGGVSTTVAAPGTAGNTSSDSNARPWATAVVFSPDNNASNQHIWNCGEGAGSTDDNIYLRQDAIGNLYFGWGRSGALNECALGNTSSGAWHGVYIAHTGERLSGANATAANLADCFSIRRMFSSSSFSALGAELSTSGNWITNGGRMDRQLTGSMTVGGRGANRSFHGKVASMVVTTLKVGQPMPTDAEVTMMIRDPQQWVADYKVGQTYRLPGGNANYGPFYLNQSGPAYGTQVWLMGDGTFDAYAQIRSDVYPGIQNVYPLNMISMVSNDIQTVNITGLS